MQPLSRFHKRALVTGASSGLGLAFARMLRAEGVEVWGTSRDPARIDSAEGIHPLALDLADPQSVGQFMHENAELLDSIDLLVNNAGAGVFSSFFELSPTDLGSQLKVLLHGPMALCHRMLPGMLTGQGGAIVNVSSLAAQFPLPWFGVYSASKAGLSQFSRALALELAGSNVYVIDFQPGDYRTGFNQAAARPGSMDEDEAALWAIMEKNLQNGPPPERAARELRQALARRRSAVVHSGSFFQATLAPLFRRAVPWSMCQWALGKYYKLK